MMEQQNANMEELYKVVDKEIVEFTKELMRYASGRLNRYYDRRSILGLSFHINGLIERAKSHQVISGNNVFFTAGEYAQEHQVAEEIVRRIKDHFSIHVDNEEINYITIFLENAKTQVKKSIEVGIVVIAHGKSTATSMAEVCNRLYGVDYIKAVDMSLDRSIEDTYEETLNVIKMVNRGHGVLLLVDMGSLVNFEERIRHDLGIQVKTIANVTTSIVLDILGRIMNTGDTLDMIMSSYEKNNRRETISSYKKRAVLSVCTTGEGAGRILKELLVKELAKIGITDIEVLQVAYTQLQTEAHFLVDIQKEYEIVASVGSINPQLSVRFFPIELMITEQGKREFCQYIHAECEKRQCEVKEEEDVFQEGIKILTQYVLFVNPVVACKYIKFLIEVLNQEGIVLNKDGKLALLLHIGCMLDRKVKGIEISFQDQKSFINAHSELFHCVKKHMGTLEERFAVSIGDSELCYIVQVLVNKI